MQGFGELASRSVQFGFPDREAVRGEEGIGNEFGDSGNGYRRCVPSFLALLLQNIRRHGEESVTDVQKLPDAALRPETGKEIEAGLIGEK